MPGKRLDKTLLKFIVLFFISLSVYANVDKTPKDANRDFIAEAFAQWAAGGRTFFNDVLAPDIVWIIKGTSPAAGTYRGIQDFMDRAVTPFVQRLATPIKPRVNNIWAEGDTVVVHWDGEATAADGKPYRNSYVWIFRMKNRRATEVIAFLDLVPYDDVIERIPVPQQDSE